MNTRSAAALLILASTVGAQSLTVEQYAERIGKFGFTGSILVAKGGEVLLARGYGLGDRENKISNSEHTLFEIASLTKPFTATAILKLEEQGKLATDDPIHKYLPGVPKARRDITIHHLLTHTSGMPRRAGGGSGDALEPAVRAYLRMAPTAQPGQRYEYWNGGYALLAGIVERASGMSYTDYCRKHLFEPAGMTKTGFTGDTHLDGEPTAIGYTGDTPVRKATGHPYRSYGYQYRGMGGIVTSVRDLYLWDRALYTDKVLGAAARKKSLTVLHKRGNAGYACGWNVLESNRKTRKVTHGGDVRGFHCYLLRFPDEDAFIVATSNSDAVPMYTIVWNLESVLFGEKPRYPIPPATTKLGAGYAGTYELSEGNRLVVRRDGDAITLGAVGLEAARLFSASGRFDEEVRLAEKVTRKIGKGDVEMLRRLKLDWIPATWPDVVNSKIWPAHVERWGQLKSVRAIGATRVGRNRVRIILALEHEKGSARCRIVLQDKRLNIFDLKGPEFAASRRYVPTKADEFTAFSWIGTPAAPIRFERDESGKVSAVVFDKATRAKRVP